MSLASILRLSSLRVLAFLPEKDVTVAATPEETFDAFPGAPESFDRVH